MALPFAGRLFQNNSVWTQTINQIKLVNLKAAKRVTVQFDPFHRKAANTRNFFFFLSAPKIIKTNVHCAFKTNIVCDRSDPVITIDLVSGDKIVLKSANLSTLEILTQVNKHVTSLAPKEEVEVRPRKLPSSRKPHHYHNHNPRTRPRRRLAHSFLDMTEPHPDDYNFVPVPKRY